MTDEDEHCGTCHYFGWKKGSCEKWCKHPDHCKPLKIWGKKCQDYRNLFSKEPIEKEKVEI